MDGKVKLLETNSCEMENEGIYARRTDSAVDSEGFDSDEVVL